MFLVEVHQGSLVQNFYSKSYDSALKKIEQVINIADQENYTEKMTLSKGKPVSCLIVCDDCRIVIKPLTNFKKFNMPL